MRLHDRVGKLREIVSTLQTFQRASNFNPRSDNAWGILDTHDDRLVRVIRALQRVQRLSRPLNRASGPVPNRSAELSSLFMAWAQARADNGEGSPEDDRAHFAFVRTMVQWGEQLRTEMDNEQSIRVAMQRQYDFYTAQQRLFSDLGRLAVKVFDHGVIDVLRARALSYIDDFPIASNLARGIANSYGRGISQASRWRRQLQSAHGEYHDWMAWHSNQRNVAQRLQSRRAPR